MTEEYIRTHFPDIRRYAGVIENRGDDGGYTMESVIKDNAGNLSMCRKYGCRYLLIENEYCVDIEL